MDNDTGKITGRETGVPASSATAVTRFRKPLVDYLISGLEENDKWIRILAAEMLGRAGDPRAVQYLKPLLVDRDRDLRIISAQAMDMIHSQQVIIYRSQPDHCATCMIRLIAEEALMQHKPGVNCMLKTGTEDGNCHESMEK
jgi:HEAT repeat protein